MNMKFGMLAVILSTGLVTGCGEDDDKDDDGEEDGGAEDGGSTTDGGGDDGGDDEMTWVERNPDYEHIGGYEWWDLYVGPTAGDLNCALAWDTKGDSYDGWWAELCDNCEMMWEVEYEPMKDVWTDDGTCGGSYFVVDGGYGFSCNFFGYGGTWVYDYYGYYYWWGYGMFDGATFTYAYGYRDYPYNGNYYTYYQYGQGDVYGN